MIDVVQPADGSDLLATATAAARRPGASGLTGEVLAERYRLVEVLGQGGMGCVYRAEHLTIGKQLAVKVLPRDLAADAEHRARFLREARAISHIDHENVVDVTDFGVASNGSMYLVMELLRGEGLTELLAREAPLPWTTAKAIFLQICRAIRAAHEKEILHRDIKPENCFLIKRGGNRHFVKVLDFGLAKALGGQPGLEASLTGVGRVLGTAEYMSPERVRDEPLDARSDVYSLGVLLYEMMTGSVPFAGEHHGQVFDQQMYAKPVPPRKVAPEAEIPAAVEAAILRALEKDPAQRFQNVAELAEALIPIAIRPRPKPRTTTTAPAVRSQSSRERVYVGAIVTLSLLVIGLGGMVVYLLLR